jgi:hypothetical protein
MSKLVINLVGGLERVYYASPSICAAVITSCDTAMVNNSGVDDNNSRCLLFCAVHSTADTGCTHYTIRVVLRYSDILLVEHYESFSEGD